MPIPYGSGYLKYFLGQKPEEKTLPSLDTPPLQFTPEILKELGLMDEADAEFQMKKYGVSDVEGLREVKKIKEAGLVPAIFPEEETPTSGAGGVSPNQITPYGKDVMQSTEEKTIRTATDLEMKKPLKIQQVKGNVVPYINDRDIPEFRPLESFTKEEPSHLTNFVNRLARGIPDGIFGMVKDVDNTFQIMNHLAFNVIGMKRYDVMGNEILKEDFLDQAQQMNQRMNEWYEPLMESFLATRDDDSWSTQIGSAFGSGLFFLAGSGLGTGLLSNGGKIATKLVPSLLGAGTTSQQMFEDAMRSGASEKDALINYFSGVGLGATEGLLGIGNIFEKIGKRTGQSLTRAFLEGGVEESIQEGVQNLGQNLTVQETYDASRYLAEGLGTSLAVSFLTGGVFTGVSTAISKLSQRKDLTEEDQIKLSQAKANLEKVAGEMQRNITEGFGDIAQNYKAKQQGLQENFSKLNVKVPTFIRNPKGNEQVIDQIVKTHNKEGGSSTGVNGKIVNGYAVGTQKGTGMIVDGKKITANDILKFIDQNKEALDNPNNFIGTWYNPDDGKTHIDVSTAVKTEEEALELGRNNDQLSVWDLKNKQDIPVIKQSDYQLKKEQDNIPSEFALPVFHYSDVDQRGFATDPKMFGENSYTRGDQKRSKLPRTFFYTDPKMAQQDHPMIKDKKPYMARIDMRKVYDLSKNEQKYGVNEYGNIDIDEALKQAKRDGWQGVRYGLMNGQVINMFQPVYVEKIDPTPTIGEIIAGKFDQMVKDAEHRLNTNYYGRELGKQLNDVTNVTAMGLRFVADMGLIMGKHLVSGTMKLGTPREFMVKLFEMYGETYPAVRRFAREIYEYARKVRDQLKANPLTDQEVQDLHASIRKNLTEGNFKEYVPTGKGVIILGGDLLAFNNKGMPEQLGVGFPKEQALRVAKNDGSVKMVKVAFRDTKTGKVYQGRETMHFMLADELMGDKDFAQSLENETLEDGFIGNDGNFYNRLATRKVTGKEGESYSQNIAVGTFEGTLAYRDQIRQQKESAKARQNSYPIWATDLGVAKQISESATIHGNDTVVFMLYPNAWNSVVANYTFQELLNLQVSSEVGEENTPVLPTQENWKKQDVRDKYVEEIKTVIKEKIKKGRPRTEQSSWTLDNLAFKWGVDNGINLAGKIVGVAKLKQVNYDLRKEGGKDTRLAPHPTYPAEIEGYNYVELETPIDFGFVYEETKGSDIGVQGKIAQYTGEQREKLRRNNLNRNLQQRGVSISREQSELINSMVLLSEGDATALNEWMQKNENTQGEIFDKEKHQEWMSSPKRQEEMKLLMDNANKSLQAFLKPAEVQLQDEKRDRFGRLPSHPDYEGGTYLASIFDQRTWNSMVVMAKAIGRGAKGFGEFAKRMVTQFGEWIKPALRSLYQAVNQIPNVFKKTGKKEVRYESDNQKSQTKADPVVNQEQVKKNNLMGRTPSVTTGYNMSREHPLLDGLIDKLLEGMRTEFDIRRRGTISNEQLKEEAKRRAEHLTDDDIWNIQQGDIANAENTLAYRIYTLNKVLTHIDEFQDLRDDSNPMDIKKATNNVVNATRMYEIVRALGTEAGRVVQSFNIPMGDEFVNKILMGLGAMKQLDPDGKMGVDQIEGMIKDMAGIKPKDAEEKRTIMEWIRYIFFNWILQNPLTDIANTFGNMSNLGFHISANIGNLGGMKTLTAGIKKGFKEGGQSALRIIHGEEQAHSKFSENVDHVDVPASKKRTWKNYFRLLVPTTRLGIEDAFFRALGRNIEMQRMSYKVGKQMGIAPDDVISAVTKIINDPELGKYSRKEYQEMAKYIKEIEDELVFQKELGKVGKGFSMISKVAFPIIPFVKTPSNILKFGISATPFGALKLFKSDLSAEEKNQIIRRALAGSVVMSSVAGMIAQGLMEITGGGSDDPFERDLMAKMGYKPYHLYINTPFGTFGGSYQNINPLNSAFAVMGDMFDKYRFNKFNNKPDEELAWYDKVAQDLSTALLSVGSSITDQSYLSGVKDLMDALAGRNPDWFMRTLTGYARMGGIQGVQQITGTLDRGSYDTKGRMMEQIQKNTPFMTNKGLIESVSAFGEQRQSEYERFPLPISKVKENTVYNWMEDNGLKLTIPSKQTKIGNRELNRAEYEIYAKRVGKLMDAFVTKLWEQQTDPELEPEKKLDLEKLQKKIDKFYDKAKDDTIEKIKEMILEQYQLNQKGK